MMINKKILCCLILSLFFCANSFAEKSFTDNGNNTVIDNGTNLIWQQGEGGAQTWENALTFCEGLVLGGKSDWRLPNIKELKSLVNNSIFSPALDTDYFPDVNSNAYWSSTTYANDSTDTWYVSFYDGGVSCYLLKTNNNYVRCVRGGQ